MLVLGLRCGELGFSCLTWELVRKAESGAQPRPTESELWGRGLPSLQPNLPAPPPLPETGKGRRGRRLGGAGRWSGEQSPSCQSALSPLAFPRNEAETPVTSDVRDLPPPGVLHRHAAHGSKREDFPGWRVSPAQGTAGGAGPRGEQQWN